MRAALVSFAFSLLGSVIDDTNRIGAESEQIGAATMDELRRQRDQLEGAEKDVCLHVCCLKSVFASELTC